MLGHMAVCRCFGINTQTMLEKRQRIDVLLYVPKMYKE